jgi:hypothetical protein
VSVAGDGLGPRCRKGRSVKSPVSVANKDPSMSPSPAVGFQRSPSARFCRRERELRLEKLLLEGCSLIRRQRMIGAPFVCLRMAMVYDPSCPLRR